MKLSIIHVPRLERPWLLKRVGGEYHQHAHFYTLEDAKRVRCLIDYQRYPYCRGYKYAMQRILTEEEFKGLRKKQRYVNIQKGLRR